MAVMPGPRTRPTVKPLATMNKRNLQQWELRLGVVQLVILLGIITGSMACAFYIGFSSGRSVGFEAALDKSLANAARIPIASEGVRPEESTTDVYAKLSHTTPLDSENHDAAGKDVDVPLGSIKTAETAPAGQDFAPPTENKNAQTNTMSEGDSIFGSASAKNAEPKAKTLGSLLEEKSAEPVAKKEPVAKVELPPPAPIAKAKLHEDVKPQPKVAAPIEKPVAKVAPKEKPSSLVRDVIPPGWFAQIAAPRKMQDANSLAGRLKSSGFAVMIEVARVRGEEYYRVLVGPEQNRAQAERLVGQLKRESYLQGDPFLRVVK